ncbi:P-loop NTPase [candidate division GN15 bacterium]|nr:P-loop NTPase [candidate division GN15 bacterium]
MVSRDAVLSALSKVEDPELKKPFAELDMIQEVTVEGDSVHIDLLLTVPGCPLKDKITSDLTEAAQSVEGVEKVDVKFSVMTDEQRERLKAKLGHTAQMPKPSRSPGDYARRVICIASGKGGVGKSTVTANLGCALARRGNRVGLLDADVYGFSIPHMVGVSGRPMAEGDQLIPMQRGENMQVMSMGFFIDENEPIIWRGPLLHKAINQFLTDVKWENLDYLLIDLPPGTGDVTITIAHAVPSAELIVVTTPQVTATSVAGRVAKMTEKTDLSVIGVIENMAYYEVNGSKDYIFGKEGGKHLAERLEVALLGEIPLDTAIREGSDTGRPAALSDHASLSKLFDALAADVEKVGAR